ncbi:hypothetical protein V7968_33335 [Nocardia vulneris]|uniref:hypothetical protein n=1 Tax=Nocardia vulneris TaxID=1141657 RepID=UPI0030D289D2
MLAAQFPELAPVLSALPADRGLVARIVRKRDGLLNTPANRDTVRCELAGRAAIPRSRSHWAQRRLVRALDRSARTTDELLGTGALR